MWSLKKAVVLFTVALVFVPSVARADDPPFVDWSSLLPGLTSTYNPDSTNICTSGKEQCVHSVIKEMDKRFKPLSDACDHDAVFALTYLRTTEEYHRFWHETPNHFSDMNWLNHYDAVFASYFFRASDDWNAGRKSSVPDAWKVAFDAADKQQVSALGNAFLGMNAHINRDLAYVLADIGLVAPDGSSRKPDHDTVNQFLNRIMDQIFPEITARYDATFDDGSTNQTTLDDFLTFQLIPAWRENAWRNAERLVSAPNAAARALVEASIEQAASAEANVIKAATMYLPLSNGKATRNAYCAIHHNDV